MSSLRGRSAAVVGGGLAALVLSAGAVAWACTPYEAGSEAAEEYAAQNPPPSQDTSPQPQPQPQPQAQTQPQPAAETQPVPQPQPQAQPQLASQPAPTAPAVNRSAAPARSARTAPSASTRRAARPASSSTAPAAAPAPAPAPEAPAPEPVASPVASTSVSGDLWSGFTAAPSSGPSLVEPAPAGTEGRGAEWAFGVGLLSAGLVALAAGTGVSAVRRSRVPAGTGGA